MLLCAEYSKQAYFDGIKYRNHSFKAQYKTVGVGSANPVKIRAVQEGLKAAYHSNDKGSSGIGNIFFDVYGTNTLSGVSLQPFTSKETKQGAYNRAKNLYVAYFERHGYYPHLSVGIEGGVCVEDDDWVPPQRGNNNEGSFPPLQCFAWVVVFDGRNYGSARSASFALPTTICKLLHEGMELGKADDMVFSRSNSSRGNGTVGHLTGDVISRVDFYVPAVILALIPLLHQELYTT